MAWQKELYRDFTGGENYKILPEAMQPNQVVLAQNCIITNDGLLESREGKTKVNTTSLGTGKILSIHRYSKENGSKYLLVQHGTSLYAKSWDGSTQFDTFGTAIKTGLTASTILRSRVWKDVIIFSNGVDTAFTYDGAAVTNVAAIPKSKVLKVYAGRLWAIDETTGLLENSNLEDYTDWSESGSYKVRDGDGDRLINLSPQPGGMVLFKQNTVQPLYGTSRFNISIGEPFSNHIGCAAIDSVLDDGLVLGKDNLYRFGLNSIEPMPQTHTPLFESLTAANKKLVFATAHPIQRRALVALSKDQMLCIDAKWNGAITSWTGLNASCFSLADDANDPGTLLIGDATNGYVYAYGGNTDDSTTFETRIKSRYLQHNTPMLKEWSSFIPEVETLEDSATYRMYYSYDVDYLTGGGLLTGSYYNNNFADFGIDNFGETIFGSSYRINDPFFMHDARGNRISYELVCSKRIRYNGFTTKYRTVGANI